MSDSITAVREAVTYAEAMRALDAVTDLIDWLDLHEEIQVRFSGEPEVVARQARIDAGRARHATWLEEYHATPDGLRFLLSNAEAAQQRGDVLEYERLAARIRKVTS